MRRNFMFSGGASKPPGMPPGWTPPGTVRPGDPESKPYPPRFVSGGIFGGKGLQSSYPSPTDADVDPDAVPVVGDGVAQMHGMTTQQSQRRAGLGIFGGPARGIIRREDGDPGTVLNYLLFGAGGVRGMREDAVRREALERRYAEAERERADLDAAISGLPPEQQAWARLNPEAFAEAMVRARMSGNEWQHGQGYSHLWRPNADGSVTLGDPLPLRPPRVLGRGGVDAAPPLPDGFILD